MSFSFCGIINLLTELICLVVKPSHGLGGGATNRIEQGLHAELGLGESLLVQARGWAELLVNRVGP